MTNVVIHLDQGGRAACGGRATKALTSSVGEVTCRPCRASTSSARRRLRIEADVPEWITETSIRTVLRFQSFYDVTIGPATGQHIVVVTLRDGDEEVLDTEVFGVPPGTDPNQWASDFEAWIGSLDGARTVEHILITKVQEFTVPAPEVNQSTGSVTT